MSASFRVGVLDDRWKSYRVLLKLTEVPAIVWDRSWKIPRLGLIRGVPVNILGFLSTL